jgi:7-cyano-7-deazaguanine synthase
MTTKALVVLSGGQDSTTALFWAKTNYDEVHAITFDYGQRHRIEIEASKRIAFLASVDSHIISNLEGLLESASPLTSNADLEQYDDYKTMDEIIGDRVEKTFVPMRNTMFLTVAANRAVALGINHIITGVCQEDNANYPDCREQFIQALEVAFCESLGTMDLKIITPLMYLSKAETVKLAATLPACWDALAYSHTSYDGNYPPTDNNHANVLRAHGFEEAGYPDPLVVRAWREGLMDLPNTANYDMLKNVQTNAEDL